MTMCIDTFKAKSNQTSVMHFHLFIGSLSCNETDEPQTQMKRIYAIVKYINSISKPNCV